MSTASPRASGGLAPARLEVEGAIPWRRLAVLAACAALLGLVALWTVPARLAPPVQAVAEPLLRLDGTALREIEVEGDGVRGVLRRDAAGEWQVAGPGIPGEQTIGGTTVQDFLAAVQSLPRLTQFVDADLAPFGLDPPRGQVVLRGAGETTIRIGDRNPALTALYVQVLPAADVVLVGSVLYWEFDKLVGSIRREAVRVGDAAEAAVGR